MDIPKSFKLFATTVTVNYDSLRLSNESVLGESNVTDNLITLCENYKGDNLDKSIILDTYYHEKVHFILDTMGEHTMSRNEKFVEVFSRLLRQSDETTKY